MSTYITTNDDQRFFFYSNEVQQEDDDDIKEYFDNDLSRDSGIQNCSSSSLFDLSTSSFDSMSHIYDSTSRCRPHVHWNDETILPLSSSSEENHFTNIKKRGQRISLNASLPFYSKLNIRIHTNRSHHDDLHENNQIKATATIQRLNPQYDHEHFANLRQKYLQHYSTLSLDNHSSAIRYEILPAQHQISLPISLPINQRLFLYIRDGEVFARC